MVDDAGDINHPIIKTERKHSKAAERVQKSFDRLLVLILTNVGISLLEDWLREITTRLKCRQEKMSSRTSQNFKTLELRQFDVLSNRSK
jgi:hypothetical protein